MGENEVERIREAEMSRLDALAVGKECYFQGYIYSDSRFTKRDPLVSLGFTRRGEGVLMSVCTVAHCRG